MSSRTDIILFAIRACRLVMIIGILAATAIAYDRNDPGMPDSVIIGNFDGSNIIASPGDAISIPVWVKGDEDIILMYFPIAIDDIYIAADSGGYVYGVMDTLVTPHWDLAEFTVNFINMPVEGYTSYPLLTMSEHGAPYDWLLFNPDSNWVKLADFRFEISSDPLLIGTSTQIIEGLNAVTGGVAFVDNDNIIQFSPTFLAGTIEIVASGYAYRPGDANMYGGIWPPAVTGGDITFLVNYFRGQANPCFLDNFYASADANGDCQIISSDVTRLRRFFMGLDTLAYCPNYPTLWPTPGDIPPSAPPGWPNCE